MSKIAIILDTFEVQIIKALLDARIEEVKTELGEYPENGDLNFEEEIIRDTMNSLIAIANKVEAAQLSEQMKGGKQS